MLHYTGTWVHSAFCFLFSSMSYDTTCECMSQQCPHSYSQNKFSQCLHVYTFPCALFTLKCIKMLWQADSAQRPNVQRREGKSSTTVIVKFCVSYRLHPLHSRMAINSDKNKTCHLWSCEVVLLTFDIFCFWDYFSFTRLKLSPKPDLQWHCYLGHCNNLWWRWRRKPVRKGEN